MSPALVPVVGTVGTAPAARHSKAVERCRDPLPLSCFADTSGYRRIRFKPHRAVLFRGAAKTNPSLITLAQEFGRGARFRGSGRRVRAGRRGRKERPG